MVLVSLMGEASYKEMPNRKTMKVVISQTINKYKLAITMPYDPNWSKNRMWCHTKKTVYKNPKAKQLCNTLAQLIQLQKIPWNPKHKLHIDILVCRESMRSDPQNCIDLICDAVELGTGVKDSWYSVSCDWTIAQKGHAAILVTIWQECPPHNS